VFLIGPDSPWTFDSRYFGPVSVSRIPYSATHLVALPL
jgi:type IV secretory pathway protease TraF